MKAHQHHRHRNTEFGAQEKHRFSHKDDENGTLLPAVDG